MRKLFIAISILFIGLNLKAQTVYQNQAPNGNQWYKIKTRGKIVCQVATSGSYAEHREIAYLVSGNYNTAEVTIMSEFNYNHKYVDIQWGYVGDAHERYLAFKSIPISEGINVNGISIYDISDKTRVIELEAITGGVTELKVHNKLYVDEIFSKVGIGTVTPNAKLSVEGGDLYVGSEDNSNGKRRQIRVYGYDNNSQFYGSFHSNFDNNIRTFDVSTNTATQQIKIDASSNSTARILLFPGSSSGVGIGTSSLGTHKLAVEGSVGAREIQVEASGWSDFVFEKDYELKSLEETEQFILTNKHLPDIPSQKEVEIDGINLGEMDAKLLQKIEELTLHLIQQNKLNKELQERVMQLENEMSLLKEK